MKTKKIVFLDASTVDLGDIDLAPLHALGPITFHKTSDASQIVPRALGADVLLTNKCRLGEKEFARLPRLKLICAAATGVNNIDLDAARRRSIAVANVAGYSTTTVAEHTLLFLLALSHRLKEHDNASRDGRWSRSGSFALLDFPFTDLSGKILGIVGYGAIGRRVATLAKAFGMKTLIARLPGRRYSKSPRRRALNQVLAASDFVTLHCPLTQATRHLIYKGTLKRLKPSAFLLNLARGPVVCEEDVAKSLKQGRLAGYAADVLSQEPPLGNHPFFQKETREKVLLTPHVAWASRESRQQLVHEMAQNIGAFFRGRKRNRIV